MSVIRFVESERDDLLLRLRNLSVGHALGTAAPGQFRENHAYLLVLCQFYGVSTSVYPSTSPLL